MAFVACTDANYDLSDINTLAQVKINNIKVPVNVDELVLDSLLDLDEDGKIKRINGSYAVVVEDVIEESDEIKFDPIKVNKPDVAPIQSTIKHDDIEFVAIPGYSIPGGDEVLNFDIPNESSVMNFTSETVDNAVRGIDLIEIEDGTGNLTINISFSNVSGVKSFVIKGLKLQLPKGILVKCNSATFNETEGTLSFDDDIKTTSLNHTINLKVTGIKNNNKVDFKAGMPKGDEDAKGSLTFKDDIKVLAGKIYVYGRNLEYFNGTSAPMESVSKALSCDNVGYKTDVKFASDLSVNVFHGNLYYNVEGISVSTVDLTDLPDELKETGTELGIENPQLYLSINNPIMQKYPKTITAEDPYAVLNITPRTTTAKGEAIKSDKVTFGKPENCIVCAPKPDGVSYKSAEDPTYDFSNINTRIPFPGLTDMLKYEVEKIKTDDGRDSTVYRVPDSLAIDIDDPVFDTKVTNFHLGTYGKVSGKYAFYAPIKLTDNSKIVYSDTIDIDSDDLDDVYIYDLLLNAAITTSAPAKSVVATAYPVEKAYETKSAKEREDRQNALKQEITITADGQGNIKDKAFSVHFDPTTKGLAPINGLTGIVFKVNVIASGKDDLKPSQTIKLSGIKATASGAYEKEL